MIDSRLSFSDWRLCAHSFVGQRRGHLSIRAILSIPLCLMVVLLIYINRSNALLLSLSAMWKTDVVIGLLLYLARDNIPNSLRAMIAFLKVVITPSFLIALIVCSCLNATLEQKYSSSATCYRFCKHYQKFKCTEYTGLSVSIKSSK
jgi:hypothetical protein